MDDYEHHHIPNSAQQNPEINSHKLRDMAQIGEPIQNRTFSETITRFNCYVQATARNLATSIYATFR